LHLIYKTVVKKYQLQALTYLVTAVFVTIIVIMNKKIIGILGFIGSGKGTIGAYLEEKHGYLPISFAGSLKDACAAIFCWDRALLEGDTHESRSWRERTDDYWSTKMGRHITPRWVLQYIGTDLLRNQFFEDIWVSSLEKRISTYDRNIVITDVRFPNEVQMLKVLGASLWWVKRGTLPEWYECALSDPKSMAKNFPNVHSSEFSWISQGPFVEIQNTGTLGELQNNIDRLL